jgi:uncharacterized protein YbaR (Trm112 family)
VKIKFEQAPEDVVPMCPFCKQRLEKVWVKSKGLGIVHQDQVIICPYCESILGYGQHAH